MATDLDTIKSTLVGISKGEGILDMLIEFERTLDNAELFAYKNWILGEIVEGPIISRYWFKVTFMYPYSMMPDPKAGLRLTKLGALVNFRKGTFSKPVKVRGPEDWSDIQSKKAKMADHDVWLVTIDMPIRYIKGGLENIDDIIQQDIEDTNEELAGAYDEVPAEDPNAAVDDGTGDMGGQPPDMAAQPGDEQQQGGV
jgi:hypothetical protein